MDPKVTCRNWLSLGLATCISRPENAGHKEEQFLEDATDTDPTEPYQFRPFPLFNDNLGSTQTVNNPDTSWRTRHLDVKYFKVRDYIREMKLTVSHIATHLNVADFFTKALNFKPFSRFRTYMGIQVD